MVEVIAEMESVTVDRFWRLVSVCAQKYDWRKIEFAAVTTPQQLSDLLFFILKNDMLMPCDEALELARLLDSVCLQYHLPTSHLSQLKEV